MKNKKVLWIIIVIIGFCVFSCIVAPFLPDEESTQENNISNEESLELDDDEIIYSKNEKINKFINDFNTINSDYAFDIDMIDNSLSYKTYIYNKKLRSIEILSKTDKEKNMISIQMENYGDTTELKNMYGAMMKVFIKNITADKINELWNQLINGKYTIDYAENNDALKYQNVYMSFSDSGDVEVYGKVHFCFVRIYGEWQ